MEDYLTMARNLAATILARPEGERMEMLNVVREILHGASPLKEEPIDLVLWVPAETVSANDYNPNAVAPPEMKLLELSISADGYTQPIVTAAEEAGLAIVDGFHRSLVGRSSEAVRGRTGGLVPVTRINQARGERPDRIAATIRHNRARGKHGVEAMSAIVLELARRNWSETKIGRELGMEPDEVLRLKQIGGLADAFADRAFSEAWEIDEEALNA